MGMKLGFTIAQNVFGYGLVIPHYGTIVVGSGNRIGNYAVLHTSICITTGKKNIGNGLYVSTGARILNDVKLGNYVTVAANAVVNKNFEDHGLLIGVPAELKKCEDEWYSGEYLKRQTVCEVLKEQMLSV